MLNTVFTTQQSHKVENLFSWYKCEHLFYKYFLLIVVLESVSHFMNNLS